MSIVISSARVFHAAQRTGAKIPTDMFQIRHKMPRISGRYRGSSTRARRLPWYVLPPASARFSHTCRDNLMRRQYSQKSMLYASCRLDLGQRARIFCWQKAFRSAYSPKICAASASAPPLFAFFSYSILQRLPDLVRRAR